LAEQQDTEAAAIAEMIFTTPRDENKSELKIKPRISVTDDIEDLQIEAGFLTVESESNYSQKM